MIRGAFPVTAALAAAIAAAAAARASAEARPLPAASDGTHAWIVVERTRAAGTEHVLLHHAVPMACDCVHEAISLPRAPEAVAADGGRVWVVLAPAEQGGRRDVYSLGVRRNPATGAFFAEPAGRMVIHPSLPPDGAILGASAADGALVVRRDGAAPESLGPGGWGPAPADALPAPSSALRAPIPGAIARAELVRAEGGRREIRFVRPAGDVRVASFEAPDRAFAVLGVGGRFGIFVPTGEGGAAVRWIDAIAGTEGAQVLLVPQPSSAAAWVCTPVAAVGAAGMLAGLAVWRIARLKSASGERR